MLTLCVWVLIIFCISSIVYGFCICDLGYWMVGFIALILTFILGYSYLPVDYYVTATFKSNIIHGEFTKEQHTITAIKGVRNYFPDTEPEVRLMINGDSIKLHEKVHMYDLPNNLKWERIDDK